MSWERLLESDIQNFITEHAQSDIRALALKRPLDASWPYGVILDQIKVRQKAKIKSPDLYETNGIIFPLNETYEQASSSACAAYKASLMRGNFFIDLTAGSGSDAYHISKNFSAGSLVEKDAQCASLLEHNMSILSQAGETKCVITVHHGDAFDYLQEVDAVDFIYIDPQRREKGRKGIYDISACSPDIVSMLPALKKVAKKAVLKTSPVLDIEKAIASLEAVTQVHVVQWQGECKEVLYVLDFTVEIEKKEVEIIAVEIDDYGQVKKRFSYNICDEKAVSLTYKMPRKYIYEPGPAFQKSGGFKSMALNFGVHKLHQHSHLYTSDRMQEQFPGKVYEVSEVISVKSKALEIKKADLTLRNFPGTVENLRKKLRLSDGGEYKIFATTLLDNQKKLIICRK